LDNKVSYCRQTARHSISVVMLSIAAAQMYEKLQKKLAIDE